MSRVGGRWIATLLALAVLLFLALVLRQSDIAAPPRYLPRCAFHLVTGWHCPGCGNTRAAHALLHGDLAGAIRQNVIFVIGLPFLGFVAWRIWMGWIYPGRIRPLPWSWKQGHTYLVVALLMVFWVLRNLPWAPFTWLAPDPPQLTESRESGEPAAPPRDSPRRAER